jgi:digeranylgeranylglycerophospholipid reductase
MTMQDVDLLVVGLGPAGSRAAWAAARAGLRVLAIDRRRRIGSPVQCAELVPALLRQDVANLGGAAVQGIDAMHTYIEDGTRDVTPHFPGAMIDRTCFDAALAHAASVAGAECRPGIALKLLDCEGIAHLTEDAAVRARVIVGADGPRSRVGRALGRVNRALTEARQVTVALARPYRATDIFLSCTMPGGYAWLFPKGGLAHVGAGVESAARARLPHLLTTLHAKLVQEGRVGARILSRTGGAIPAGGMVDPVARMGRAAVLLAGDAAGLANPVTGAGISAAVQSGALAGAAAAAWIGGDTAALTQYAEELEALFGPALARAVERRRALLEARAEDRAITPEAQRRAWIAYPEYWAA